MSRKNGKDDFNNKRRKAALPEAPHKTATEEIDSKRRKFGSGDTVVSGSRGRR